MPAQHLLGGQPCFHKLSVVAAQVKHLQETMSMDAETIQGLQTQCDDAQAIIDSFEEQAANQVGGHNTCSRPATSRAPHAKG